jgi:beta-N-acetylhexosaminidase
VLSVLLLLSCARAPGRPAVLPPAPLGLPAETWVHNTLIEMTLEERVGQLLMVPLPGGFENMRGTPMRDAQRLVRELHIGGFSIGLGSPLDVAIRLNELQGIARLPLLAAAAMEWGPASNLRAPTWLPQAVDGGGGTAFPFNMGLAATGDPLVADLAGRITAAEARAVGIHWLLAPVVDVNTTGDNPLINVRSYSSDPGTVSTFAAAFIRGASTRGVLTTAAHFPGHGDTRIDSHVGLPVLNLEPELLRTRELRPFRAAIDAGVSSVMLGHIAVPSLTGGTPVPASLAPEIASQLLRRELGFTGLVITDAMTMGALRETRGYSPGELAVRAVEAGADVVLSPPDPYLAHRAIVAAVRSGRLHYSRVDSSVVRILRAKAAVGLHRQRTVPLDSVIRVVGAPEHEIVAADIAARSLTLARDSAALLPLDPRRTRSMAVVAFTAPDDVGAGRALAAELTEIYGRGVMFMRVDETTATALEDSVVARASRADATIFATFQSPVPGLGHLAVPIQARRLAARLSDVSSQMMVVSFGDPYGPATLPGASTYLLAWQPHGRHAERAAARALAGRTAIPGRLPVELPRATTVRTVELRPVRYGLDFAAPDEVGMDAAALAAVDSIILAGILAGAAPGAAVAVGRHGRLVKLRGYGTLDRHRSFGPVTDSTIYDLASVTKVMATTMALMMLIDDGLLSLDDPVARHLPEWRGSSARESVTLRNLLLHNSGLPAYAPFWTELTGREQYRRRITAMSLQYEPGTRTVYSDLGVILLGLIIEQVSGQTLDEIVRTRLFAPLGLRDTGFNPRHWPYAMLEVDESAGFVRAAPEPAITRIAPTENDTIFRHRHVHGLVHDENAYALGGVAGHAGLFSSARDMAVFAQLMLNRGFYGARRYVDPATIDLFTRRQDASSSRALGWDTPEGASSAGSYFSASSFGHTGFTGPSIWIDPERDVFVVLLMNRVNPSRDNQRHVGMRRDVADAVQLAIRDMVVTPRGVPY